MGGTRLFEHCLMEQRIQIGIIITPMVLHQMAGADQPPLAAEQTEHPTDLGLQLVAGHEAYGVLDADPAQNGELVGVFLQIRIVGHTRPLLPGMDHVKAQIHQPVGHLHDTAVGVETTQAPAGVDMIHHLLEVGVDDPPPQLGAEHEILLGTPVVRDVDHIHPQVDAVIREPDGPLGLAAVELVQLVGVDRQPHEVVLDAEQTIEILKEALKEAGVKI